MAFVLKNNGKFFFFDTKFSSTDNHIYFFTNKGELAKVSSEDDYSVVVENNYHAMTSTIKPNEKYVEIQSLGGMCLVKYIETNKEGKVVTEKKNSQRIHNPDAKLVWAKIPSNDFIFVSSADTFTNELRPVSSVASSVISLPPMEDYGSKLFRTQFSSIVDFVASIDGIPFLCNLEPLTDIPSNLMDLGKVDTKVVQNCRLEDEEQWTKKFYIPLLKLTFDNAECATFGSSDYQNLFKGKWQNIHSDLCKSLGIRVKHPCCYILAFYDNIIYDETTLSYPIFKSKTALTTIIKKGIPFFWAECKRYSNAELVNGEDQLFLETLFFSLFFEKILGTFTQLYVPLFYGDYCAFYKLDKQGKKYQFISLGGGTLQQENIYISLTKVRQYSLSLAFKTDLILRASAENEDDELYDMEGNDIDYCSDSDLLFDSDFNYELHKQEMSKKGLTENKLKLWETMCVIQERFPNAVFDSNTLNLFSN